MQLPRSLFLIVLSLFIQIPSASNGVAQVLSQDPKYAAYNQFFSFDLKVASDYKTNKKHLILESKIIETTMHPPQSETLPQPLPSVKKFYKKLELYYNKKARPALVMDLTPLGFENAICVPGPPISDGYIADTLEIKFSAADLKAFQKLKPTDAHVVLYDAEGKIVTSADVSIAAE